MHKPPLPPKPKLVQPLRPGLSPSTHQRDGLSLPSPDTPLRVKPQLPPKPCLSKLSTAVEARVLTSKSQAPLTDIQRTEGLLKSQKDIQQENKKTNWDYIIPICLCRHENCMCFQNASANVDKLEKELKILHRGTIKTEDNRKPLPTSLDNSGDKTCERLQETFAVDRNLNTAIYSMTVKPPGPQRTWSDEANGNIILQSAPGRGPEEDANNSEQTSAVVQPKPVSTGPRKPVPVPRKPKMAVLARQEKVEEEREEITSQEGRETNVKEVKVQLLPSASVPAEKQPIVLSARKTCAMTASPPRKNPFLSAPNKPSTSAPQKLPKDVEEETLGWDSSSHEMEVSLDKGDEEVERAKEETQDQEAEHTDFSGCPPSSSSLNQLDPPAIPVTAEDVPVRVALKKPQKNSSPMAWTQKNDEKKDKEKLTDKEKRPTPLVDGCVSKDRIMKELPLPPAKSTNKTIDRDGAIKPSRPSLNRQKSKSFSGVDLFCSKRQRRNSFRKRLELKLSAMMLPKLMVKGGQRSDRTLNDNEQSVDRNRDGCQNLNGHLSYDCKFPFRLVGVEQSVDGDEQDLFYENVSHYEEISDYINVDVGMARASPPASVLQPPACESLTYNDEGIYEEPEPYVPLDKNTDLQQCLTPTAYERSSIDEEVAPLDEGHSDDDILANSSDAEDDSSSTSSKGDSEQPEKSSSGQKKSKIHHIATEVMTSESVFVDVLKLLHVDFRDAVTKASRQNGKPVIEESLLNQILYYLPQLYELNQDLLRELQQRVAKWHENAQLADIFLKKGPYLKMYSTYIREFDKNVTLLEEQSKRNPAFGAVVREFEANPRCANLALKHYLLKPVQRIPQYQLLLMDYLKNLSEDSDDYKDTEAALAIVKEVANHANDIMKHGDNFQKLFQVQSILSGHHEIVQPGRVFLKEGFLMKLSRKVMQPRMFFLFNDTLLYTTPVQLGQYKLKNMLSLAGMKVSKPSQEAYQNELNIESVERSFILSASSASERDEWLEAISTAITDYTRKKISFISGKPLDEVELYDQNDGAPLGSKAPIWIPDQRTTMCMVCTSEFNVTWRRHHCRACGKVVCQACSSNKYCLEYLKNQTARVCDHCFLILHHKSEQALSAAVSPGNKATLAFSRKQKKIPAALKEVSANTDSSMSGYLQMSKGNKKQGKRLWFVIKDKVLYTYAASENVAASESQPLLGFILEVDSTHKLQFKLYHKKTLYYIFKAEDIQTAQRWIDSFKEATVL